MIDSGAQLNVISESVLNEMKFEVIPHDVRFIQAFTGKTAEIICWVNIQVSLSNGKELVISCAVVSGIESAIVLGLPFLNDISGVIDFKNRVIRMQEGIISMSEGRRLPSIGLIETGSLHKLEDFPMPALTSEEKQQVLDLLKNYESSWRNQRRGLIKEVSHVIKLDTARPLVTKARKFCREQQDAIEKEIEKMLADGVIRLSGSPYASEIVMVKKKTGEWRVCVDYRLINKHTVTDSYPMPRIPDLLRSIKNSTFLVSLDLRSGYWQIPMDPESKSATAFRSPQGLYEFEVMPFGLKNAPATFQRTMDFLLGDLYSKGVGVYLDDILIHSTSFTETKDLLVQTIHRLQGAGLTINIEKSSFFETEIEYLGHIVGNGALKPNPKKVSILSKIRIPATSTELRSLLGMFGYYQQYIHRFSEIVESWTNALKGLSKGNQKIEWTLEMQLALEKCSKMLSEAVLKIPIDSDVFLLETDASNTAIAGILSVRRDNKWAPIEFVSKKLSGAELRWPTREKEAFAIIHCLRKFDGFLRTRRFTVHTDHQSLKWLKEALTGKLARWASRLQEYEMDICWKKGSEIQHVDFFSRHIDPDSDIQPRMIYNITVGEEAYRLPSLAEVISAQTTVVSLERGFIRRDNVTYYRNGIWPPSQFRLSIIEACHSLPPNCHPGVKRTKSSVLKVFNWPKLHEDVTKYVRGCLYCQFSRPGLERLQGVLKTHPISRIFETVYVDFWHCSYKGESKIVLTMVDQASKWVEAKLIPDQKGCTVADTLLQEWFCRFGVPLKIITDNDPPFISDSLERVAAQMGIEKVRTTPYHPQGNAPVEAFHKTLNKRLFMFNQRAESVPFETALQLILWSYRAVMHTTLGESPFFMLFGTDPLPPLENDWRFFQRIPEQDRLKFLNLIREETQLKAYQRFKYYNDEAQRRIIDSSVAEGDLVLIRNQPKELLQAATRDGTSKKLVPRWSLPNRVIRKNKNSNRFVVRSLMTGREREVHITDIRGISPPNGALQQQQWDGIISDMVSESVFDEPQRKRILERFWEEVNRPQAKRVRVEDKKFEGATDRNDNNCSN